MKMEIRVRMTLKEYLEWVADSAARKAVEGA
jgi:hypothetical protein